MWVCLCLNLYCGDVCKCACYIVCVCECVGFVMCDCVYVVFCYVWLCVCVVL